MINLNKITNYVIYLLLSSPLLSYMSFGILGLRPFYFYLKVLFILYGVVFVFLKDSRVIITSYTAISFVWSIYYLIRTLFDFEIGINSILNPWAISFMLLIISNTKFESSIINNILIYIHFIIVCALIASVIQVFDTSFLNSFSLWDTDGDVSALSGTIYTHRRTSIFGYVDQNELGLSFIPMFSILLVTKLRKRENVLIIFSMTLIIILLSNSRSSILGFIVLSLVLLKYFKFSVKNLFKGLIGLAILFFLSLVILNTLDYDYSLWMTQRLVAEGAVESSARYLALETFGVVFPERPIFGYGDRRDLVFWLSPTEVGSLLHVLYLHLFAYHGLFGGSILFMMWIMLMKSLYNNARLTNFWGAYYGFVVFFVINLTLYMYSIFYVGLIICLIFDKFHKDQFVVKNFIR